MNPFSSSNARRALYASVIALSVAVSGLSAASAQPSGNTFRPRPETTTTIDGVVASQPNAIAKLQSCSAVVTGATFVPQIVFDPAATVKTSSVTFAFFDKANMSLGQISLSPPYTEQPLPKGADNFTCAIAHEELADGSVFPTTAHNNTGLVVGGIVGVALIAALAGHGGSGSTPQQQNTPTPPTPTPTPVVTVSPTPTPTLAPTSSPSAQPSPIVTATPTATPSASPTAIGATPSPTPSATVKPTATPTASPTAIGATPSPTPTATASSSATPTGTPTATASPTATPSPTPTPSPVGVLTLNPNSLTFTSDGATMNSTIAESGGYTGTFSIQSETCASGGTVDGGPIATVSPSNAIPNPTNLVVTSDEPGNCQFTFKDSNGNIAVLTIDVTTTSVVVNGKHPTPRKLAPVAHPQRLAPQSPVIRPTLQSSAIKPTPQAGSAPHAAR